MGFNSNFSGSFRTFGNKVKRVVLAPFDMAFRRFKQKTAVNTVFNKISEDVRSEVKSITKKPESQKEYFVFGDRYVAKKIVYVAGILLMFFIIFMINKGYPAIVEKWFTKTMIVNDIEVADYSGRVRLLSERDRETVLFVGKLTEGAIEGNGTLYDYDGNLVYKGSFTDGLYEGEGVMYYPNGNVTETAFFMTRTKMCCTRANLRRANTTARESCTTARARLSTGAALSTVSTRARASFMTETAM